MLSGPVVKAVINSILILTLSDIYFELPVFFWRERERERATLSVLWLADYYIFLLRQFFFILLLLPFFFFIWVGWVILLNSAVNTK